MPMRRKFSREFKLEAVRLVRERGVSVAQACRDLDVAESVLRRWMREVAGARAGAAAGPGCGRRRWVREVPEAPTSAFPGQGRGRSEQAEIAALKKEVARLKAERDMPQQR